MRYLYLSLIMLSTYGCASSTYYYQGGEKQVLTPIENEQRSNQDVDYYETQDGLKVGVTNTLLVKFLDTKNLDSYLSEYNLEVEEELLTNLYKLKTKDRSLTIQIANALSQKDDIKYAHPNFIKTRIER